jgi:glycogen debranching enzyme
VADADPELAWNQLLLFFDHQDPNGMIPDMIHDQAAIYCFTKPPIYGWTIRKLIEKCGIKVSRPYLEVLYKPVSRLTEWWYTMRDFDGDGMCQYHHGNDSGWDNATLFDQGYPTEGADLAAHLMLQSEGLSYIARAIGKKVASLRWKERADHQLSDLLTQGVRNNRFHSPLDGKIDAPETQSLLNYIPIVLGRRIPKNIRKALVSDLGPGGPFLTEWGLATESPSSTKYESDGYWRGPIWAPSTYLIFDGLVAAGEKELATLIAQRFCTLCSQDAGFWENYDALTGKGLRCPGYTWTASVFLLLAGWLYVNG